MYRSILYRGGNRARQDLPPLLSRNCGFRSVTTLTRIRSDYSDRMYSPSKGSVGTDCRAFQAAILGWFSHNGRTYPWRETSDPFKLLVAEVVLRLTGADRVLTAYEYIVEKYGTPTQMASADREDLYNVFAGLGFFKRADLLVGLASDIEHRFGRRVPCDYEQLISMKAVGPYTANAVLCFSYNRRVPLVDGRIFRVLNRHFSLFADNSHRAERAMWTFAADLLPTRGYREYNLGLLDLGTIVCRHARPLCASCPVSATCLYHERRQTHGARNGHSEPPGA